MSLVLFEGWMLGFAPVPDGASLGPMRAPNAMLEAYAPLFRCDAFVLLRAAELRSIVAWRVDAERARRTRGEPALSDEEAADYIERFLAAYELYVPPLAARLGGAKARVIDLGRDRLPLGRRDA